MHSFKLEFSPFLSICAGVGLLDYMVALFLVFCFFYFLAAPGLSYSTWDLCCHMWDLVAACGI